MTDVLASADPNSHKPEYFSSARRFILAAFRKCQVYFAMVEPGFDSALSAAISDALVSPPANYKDRRGDNCLVTVK